MIWEQLDPRARCIRGRADSTMRLPECHGAAGLILLGYHAMAGTANAVIDHTFTYTVQNLWINGVRSGEIGVDASIAADYGIPTIMISGDDKACAEASAIIPGILTASVKKGLGRIGADLMSQKDAHALIRTRAAEAVRACAKIKPYKVSYPVTVRQEFAQTLVPVNRGNKPYYKQIDARTYEVTGATAEEAFMRL
jgi:D-amino peptidase